MTRPASSKIPDNGVDGFALEGIADHPEIDNQRIAYGRHRARTRRCGSGARWGARRTSSSSRLHRRTGRRRRRPTSPVPPRAAGQDQRTLKACSELYVAAESQLGLTAARRRVHAASRWRRASAATCAEVAEVSVGTDGARDAPRRRGGGRGMTVSRRPSRARSGAPSSTIGGAVQPHRLQDRRVDEGN